MSVPGNERMMVPLLEALKDGKERSMSEATSAVAAIMGLTEADLRALVPSKRKTKFAEGLSWAKRYLVRDGLLESPSRGTVKITSRGQNVLNMIHREKRQWQQSGSSR